jgi:hypothetical protein
MPVKDVLREIRDGFSAMPDEAAAATAFRRADQPPRLESS